MIVKRLSLMLALSAFVPAAVSCCRAPGEKKEQPESSMCKLFKIGCPETKPSDGGGSTQPPPVNLNPIFTLSKDKVFLVGSNDAGYQGTAFLIQNKGQKYLLTNFHVISPLKDIFVETEDKVAYKDISILAVDRKHDVALLEAKALKSGPSGLNFSPSYVTSQPISVIGYPDMRSKEQHLNFITGVISDANYMAPCYIGSCDEKNIQFTAAINPGHSGSPVLNERGEAIGVVSWRFGKDSDIQGGNYAVPFMYVTPLLREIETRKLSVAELYPEGKTCAADADCDWIYFCIDGTCRKLKDLGQTCAVHGDCYMPYNCMGGVCSRSGSAGEACQYDSQCAAPNYCILGSCRPIGQKGDDCTIDTDCVSPLYCISKKCVAELSGVGGKCEKNSDCKYPYNCVGGACKEVDVGSIKDKTCTADADCSPLYCIMGKCSNLRKEGETCEKTIDCESGLKCGKKGTCVPLSGPGDACKSDYDCKLPLYCIKGKCKEKDQTTQGSGLGSPCTSDAECTAPNYCILSKCRPLGSVGDPCKTYLDCKSPLKCAGDKCAN